MPTDIIIPKHHSHRRHSSVVYPSSVYPTQTYVQTPGIQYAPSYPLATSPVIATTPYITPAAPMVATTPYVQPYPYTAFSPSMQPIQPVATAVSPVMTAMPRPYSAPPMTVAGSVYGEPVAYGAPMYEPYGYGIGTPGYYPGGMYGVQPVYEPGYGYGGGMYNQVYPGVGYGYGGVYPRGSAYEYYNGARVPFNQRVAGAIEQFSGHLVDSPDMVARGYARRHGYPLIPSTAQADVGRTVVGPRYVPGVGTTYL